jgi:Chaperone of endosialidase
MTNKSISQLTAGASVSSTDIFPDVQTAGVGPVKVTAAQIGNYVLTGSGLTGALPVANGGTGLTSLTAGYIPYGNGTGAFSSGSGLTYSGTNLTSQTSSTTYATSQITAAADTANLQLICFGSAASSYGMWNANDVGLFSTYNINLMANGGSSVIKFATGGATERMRLDAAGNLGLGVTPSAWSGLTAFQLPDYGTIASKGANLWTGSNFYYVGGGVNRYATTAAATQYTQQSGAHYWFTAPSGTAGNAISFTQAMTLDASGQLGIGTSSPANRLDSYDPSAKAAGLFHGYSVIGANANTNNGCIQVGANGSACLRLDNDAVTGGTNTASIYNTYGGPLVFGTNNTERARIDSSGNLLVGQSSQNSTEKFGVTFTAGNAGIYTKVASTATQYHITFNNGSVVGAISTNGSATTYSTSSDISLKTNIANAANSLASILALPIRQFDWKADVSHTDYGVVAQEAYEHAPEMVTQGDLWSVDYGRITPRLIKAFQELAAKVSALEAKQ